MAAVPNPIQLHIAELDPPELTSGAAVVLLRILRKARERQEATERGRSVTDDRDVA
jgi:hypothetical protein